MVEQLEAVEPRRSGVGEQPVEDVAAVVLGARAEVDVVEKFEEFGSEVEAALGDFGVLYDSKIRVEKARAAQDAPAGIAKRPPRSKLGLNGLVLNPP